MGGLDAKKIQTKLFSERSICVFHLTHRVGNEIRSYELRGGSRVQAELKRQIVFHDCSPAPVELSKRADRARSHTDCGDTEETISELSSVYLCSAT